MDHIIFSYIHKLNMTDREREIIISKINLCDSLYVSIIGNPQESYLQIFANILCGQK